MGKQQNENELRFLVVKKKGLSQNRLLTDYYKSVLHLKNRQLRHQKSKS